MFAEQWAFSVDAPHGKEIKRIQGVCKINNVKILKIDDKITDESEFGLETVHL